MRGARFAYIDQKIRHSLSELRSNQVYDWDHEPTPEACEAAERLVLAEIDYDQEKTSETEVKKIYKDYVKTHERAKAVITEVAK